MSILVFLAQIALTVLAIGTGWLIMTNRVKLPFLMELGLLCGLCVMVSAIYYLTKKYVDAIDYVALVIGVIISVALVIIQIWWRKKQHPHGAKRITDHAKFDSRILRRFIEDPAETPRRRRRDWGKSAPRKSGVNRE